MALYAKLTCFPPLSQVTVLQAVSNHVQFTAVIEWNGVLPDYPWNVDLCISTAESPKTPRKWKQFSLQRSKFPLALLPSMSSCSSLPDNHNRHAAFSTCLSLDTDLLVKDIYCQFTIKYQADSCSPWHWTHLQPRCSYGELIRQRVFVPHPSISNFIDLQEGWSARVLLEANESTSVIYLAATKSSAGSHDTCGQFRTKLLGRVIQQHRSLHLARITEPWLAPRHGSFEHSVAEDAVMACYLTQSGMHITLLAENGVNNRVTVLRSDEDFHIVVAVQDEEGDESHFRVICAAANTLENSIAAAFAGLRTVMRHSNEPQNFSSRLSNTSGRGIQLTNENQKTEEWNDSFQYCTYNSLGVELTLPKILDSLDSLTKHGIKISSLIIDDNWQTIEDAKPGKESLLHRAWEQFEANPACFPKGLKSGIAEIRSQNPHIKNIAVWHALLGYWAGLSPNGKVAQDYKTMQLEARIMEHKQMEIFVAHPDEVHRLYDDFYAFLSSCGITAVKTDAQFLLNELSSSSARSSLTTAYQEAWMTANRRHFSSRAISCMSMIPQILFRFLDPDLSKHPVPRILLRNSDDFFPEIPSSHPHHIFINAHNALLTQHLHVLPDWDMFQTLHPYGAYHAAARCVSGSPLLITDPPGQHDIGLILEMTALDRDDRTIALRPTTVGRVLGGYEPFNTGQVLRVCAATGAGRSEAGILGVFNVTEHEITFLLSVADIVARTSFADSNSAKSLLVRSHCHPRTLWPIDLASKGSVAPTSTLVYIVLPTRGYDILTGHQIHETCRCRIAVLGLMGKMTGVAAMTGYEISSSSKSGQSGIKISVVLKALGTLGIWIGGENTAIVGEVRLLNVELEQCWVATQVETMHIQGIAPRRVTPEQSRTVEIDLLGAWRTNLAGKAKVIHTGESRAEITAEIVLYPTGEV